MSLHALYLGDTSLRSAASYLAGIMHGHGIAFDYLASDLPFSAARFSDECRVLILSDYMSRMFTRSELEMIVSRVQAGLGLLMIGGWDSFVGAGGDYHQSPLAAILPVHMQTTDDRVNSFAPCMIRPEADHPIIEGLPFAETAAAINGYNRWQARDEATTLLSTKRYSAAFTGGDFQFTPTSLDPLLVVSHSAGGRVACYAGDVAPHWAGGFVDWGNERRVLHAPGAEEVEVGNWYVEFFGRLIQWVAREL